MYPVEKNAEKKRGVGAFWFPAQLDLLEERYQDTVTGMSLMAGGTAMVDGIPMKIDVMTPVQADTVMQVMESIDFTSGIPCLFRKAVLEY